jgi:hypothetical protein
VPFQFSHRRLLGGVEEWLAFGSMGADASPEFAAFSISLALALAG